MPFIVLASLLSRDAERLARRAAGPEFPVVGPSGESGGECPSADSGEEVTLPVSGKVGRRYFHDASIIYVSVRDKPRSNQIAQPLSRIWVDLVVVSSHRSPFCCSSFLNSILSCRATIAL